MDDDYLTVGFVKDMLYAWTNQELVRAAVRKLRRATLPGIIEYGSLAWNGRDDIPSLPPAVMNSPIGQAWSKFDAHLRHDPPWERETRTVACRPVEFTALRNKEDIEGEAWQLFAVRFSRSAQRAGFSRTTAGHLGGALAEMADNALVHSNARFPIVAGYHVLNGFAQFSVIDTGIGVFASLHACPDYSYLKTDVDALHKALHDGVTSLGHQRGGFGFRPVFKAVAAQWGALRFRSGQGCLVIDGTDCSADKGAESFVPFLPGFHVSISCCLGSRAPVREVA
jgi:anti-sigma regulatory factor (Ser/Thr protein kinase)